MLFTGTTNLPFSTPHIYLYNQFLSNSHTYYMLSIYATFIPNLKKLGPVVHKIYTPKNCPIFFTFFFFTPFHKSNFEPTKNIHQFLSNLAHLHIRHFVAYISLKFGDVSVESKGVMDNNITKNI